MKPLVLKPQQEEAVRRISNEPTRASLVAAGTGFGKTLIAVETAKAIGAKQVLAIVPVKTKDSWALTAKAQGFDSAQDITSSKKGLEAADALFSGEPGFYLIGKEFFALAGTQKRDKNGEVSRKQRWDYRKLKHIDMVVLDESHGAQNRQSTLARALRGIPKTAFKLAMSATPAGNNFDGFWFPCHWLWPKHVVNPKTQQPYVDHRYHHWVVQWANKITKYITLPDGRTQEVVDSIEEKNPGSFVNSLPCYVYYEAPKVPVHTRQVSVPLSEKQQDQYRQMEDHYMVWLDEQPAVADLTIVQKTRLRQIGLGEINFVPGKEEGKDEIGFADDCESAKADTCIKLSTEHHPNEQMIFYTSSEKFARVLSKRMPYTELWAGTVTQAKRNKLKEMFIEGQVKNIVATIPSVAEGLDGLQLASNIEVWLDRSFNGILNQQCEGRLNRQGQKRDHIIRYNLLSPMTDDEMYLNKLISRRVSMRRSLGA